MLSHEVGFCSIQQAVFGQHSVPQLLTTPTSCGSKTHPAKLAGLELFGPFVNMSMPFVSWA